uniref:Uncharacterized protein n=1 Tax=Anguilla anguilla TaxID=7936 RepID=A0A0E9Q7G7_ANGAN
MVCMLFSNRPGTTAYDEGDDHANSWKHMSSQHTVIYALIQCHSRPG